MISVFKDAVERDWSSVSNLFLDTLAAHMETEWPEGRIITGYISIIPVCPRFLDKLSFYINFKKSLSDAREIIAHEILHFLWFKKWKEVFPESKRGEYEAPHLVWRLSEIMDPIILQCHPEIQQFINPKSWGYNVFKTIKIGNVGMTEYFARVYKECLVGRISFEDTQKTLWGEAEKNREALEKF